MAISHKLTSGYTIQSEIQYIQGLKWGGVRLTMTQGPVILIIQTISTVYTGLWLILNTTPSSSECPITMVFACWKVCKLGNRMKPQAKLDLTLDWSSGSTPTQFQWSQRLIFHQKSYFRVWDTRSNRYVIEWYFVRRRRCFLVACRILRRLRYFVLLEKNVFF